VACQRCHIDFGTPIAIPYLGGGARNTNSADAVHACRRKGLLGSIRNLLACRHPQARTYARGPFVVPRAQSPFATRWWRSTTLLIARRLRPRIGPSFRDGAKGIRPGLSMLLENGGRFCGSTPVLRTGGLHAVSRGAAVGGARKAIRTCCAASPTQTSWRSTCGTP